MCSQRMRHPPIKTELFIHNREKLRQLIKKDSIVIIHSNDTYPTNADGTMPFRQNSDLYYLTGIHQAESILVLMPEVWETTEREVLFIKETNEFIAIWEGKKLNKEEATSRSGISHIEWEHTFEDFLQRWIPQCNYIYLATNEHTRASTIVETRNDRFVKACQKRFPLHHYERLAPVMHRLRMNKHPLEIEAMRKACEITKAGFLRVLNYTKPGVAEWEIEAEFIHEFIRQGSRGFAYTPIIGSGKNACVLHYIENHSTCKENEVVLMDVAAEYAGWNADMTRCIPVSGKFSPRQKEVYQSVLRVMRGANELLRPGKSPTIYHQEVLILMEVELIALQLIDATAAKQQGPNKALVKKYFMHGVSHHLGLDVHDVALANEPFSEGMVMTIEPGIYIVEESLGIRLENCVVIGKDRNIDLMQDIPIELEEIEKLMQRKK